MLVVQGTPVHLNEISEYESYPFLISFFFIITILELVVVGESEAENKNHCENTVLVYTGSNSIPGS